MIITDQNSKGKKIYNNTRTIAKVKLKLALLRLPGTHSLLCKWPNNPEVRQKIRHFSSI